MGIAVWSDSSTTTERNSPRSPAYTAAQPKQVRKYNLATTTTSPPPPRWKVSQGVREQAKPTRSSTTTVTFCRGRRSIRTTLPPSTAGFAMLPRLRVAVVVAALLSPPPPPCPPPPPLSGCALSLSHSRQRGAQIPTPCARDTPSATPSLPFGASPDATVLYISPFSRAQSSPPPGVCCNAHTHTHTRYICWLKKIHNIIYILSGDTLSSD